eukprot:CAMPEP_0172946076 /NCGR_PEP_ID=MMETSP1075-20121228/226868_1 /TAXON_ID=2916 /ORGANISM="Ceratium fusus, Strain PA161109" /LENGTH=702 /DNA_ID=CAMNT_0013807527 /DNA_START=484 /DNA_END=2592 /DNA_ORIENTATION=+
MVGVGTLALAILCAFFAKCVLVVRSFPARVRDQDVQFLKAWSFVFMRYTPQAYGFLLFHMFRGFCISVVPLFPNYVAQSLMVQIVLVVSQTTTLLYRPWSAMLANVVDSILIASIVLLVTLAGLFEEEVDTLFVAWCALGVLTFALSCIPAMMLVGVYQSCRNKTKRFQFFLCHHKAGVGAFVRLLKMRLVASGRVRNEVFVDADNLSNLNCLFDTVANETGTLVIVASHGIFQRLWCIGEMNTAKAQGIPTVVVAMPDFNEPSDDFIEHLEDHVQDLESVYCGSSGITLEDLKETLRWVRLLPRIDMPKGTLSLEHVDNLVKHIICGKTGRVNSEYEPAKPGCSLFMLANRSNSEAVATGLVLQAMLLPHLISAGRLFPHMLRTQERLPSTAKVVMVLCSNGFLADDFLLSQLLNAKKLHAWVFPVVCEEAFHFPPQEEDQIYNDLKAAHDVSFSEVQLKEIAGCVWSMFREIAVTFVPHHSTDSVLQASVQDLARRFAGRRDLSGKMSMKKSMTESEPRTTVSTEAGMTHTRTDLRQQLRVQWSQFSFTTLLSRSGSRLATALTPEQGAELDEEGQPKDSVYSVPVQQVRRGPRQSLSAQRSRKRTRIPTPAPGELSRHTFPRLPDEATQQTVPPAAGSPREALLLNDVVPSDAAQSLMRDSAVVSFDLDHGECLSRLSQVTAARDGLIEASVKHEIVNL